MAENKKPYIILSAAMTIDGKIASKDGDPELSDEEDWREVHKLRSEVDAIMVGKGTILKDDPKLHIKYHKHNGYKRIVVDSKLEIPIESNVIIFEQELYPTIICTTENVTDNRNNIYEESGIKIIKSGKKKKVDLVKLMRLLYDQNIRSILLEGGGTLNWGFFKNNLVDEIRITIAPWIIGGKNATSLVEGGGFSKMIEGKKFRLFDVRSRNNYVKLNYKKLKK